MADYCTYRIMEGGWITEADLVFVGERKAQTTIIMK